MIRYVVARLRTVNANWFHTRFKKRFTREMQKMVDYEIGTRPWPPKRCIVLKATGDEVDVFRLNAKLLADMDDALNWQAGGLILLRKTITKRIRKSRERQTDSCECSEILSFEQSNTYAAISPNLLRLQDYEKKRDTHKGKGKGK
jgi:hypothetical protein